MKSISWNPEKNALLKKERAVSFEDVVFHIMAGDILDTFDHPNQKRYPRQQIHVKRSAAGAADQRRRGHVGAVTDYIIPIRGQVLAAGGTPAVEEQRHVSRHGVA